MLSGARRPAVLHIAAAILIIGIAGPAMSKTVSPPAGERIGDDNGGRIGTCLSKYEALRKSGQRVVIDGTCASACTLLLGLIPHSRICVTPRAVLAFHAAWDLTLTGPQTNSPGTKSVVALSGRRAPMDRAARRIAVADNLSWRA
jgi:hypothetical protein